MRHAAALNINYEVKDLVRTIDFYNVLLGERPADLYPKHAIYSLKDLLLTLTFIEDLKTTQPVCGNFSLVLNSDNDVYERFINFTRAGFANTIKVDHGRSGHDDHAFSIKDPNGIFWKLSIKDKKTKTFKFFNIPRLNSVWDILKPL